MPTDPFDLAKFAPSTGARALTDEVYEALERLGADRVNPVTSRYVANFIERDQIAVQTALRQLADVGMIRRVAYAPPRPYDWWIP